MEREMEPIAIQEQKERDVDYSGKEGSDKELANEVYVFVDKNKLGFKFYDRTPEEGSAEARLVGTPPKGVYYAYGIETAEWDEEINQPGETVPVMYKNGTNTVTTIMVTEQEMEEILEQIRLEEQKESIDGKIRIDLRQREKEVNIEKLIRNSINDIKKEDLNKLKLEGLNLENKKYDNKKEDFDF